MVRIHREKSHNKQKNENLPTMIDWKTYCNSTYDSGNVSKTTKAIIVLDLKPLHALSKLALLISTSMVYY